MNHPEAQSLKPGSKGLRLVAFLVLAAAALLPAIGCRVEKAARRPVVVWQPIGAWSGRASLQTESFISNSGMFRIQWESRRGDTSEPGRLRVTLHSAVSGRPLAVAVDSHGAGRDTAYVNEDPREFYLVVDAALVDWTVAIEEGIRATAPGR